MSEQENPSMVTEPNINITTASLRGSPSDRIIKPRPRKDSLQSISGSDSHPGRVVKPRARKSPGSGAKRSEPAKRKFICSFSHYGCDVALSSKNEWKRHVSIQHLQLGFYRCDVGSCNPELNPNVPGHKRVYNDFNRKDLFTQHHRRMHKPESGPGSGTYAPNNESSKDWRAFEDSLEQVRIRCWKERRRPPQRSTCGFCGRVFEGEGSWNERMEHVGGHFSRDIVEAKEEREDEDLTEWAVKEAIIKDGGNGRHVLIDQPATPGERPYMHRDRDVSMTEAPNIQTPSQMDPDGIQQAYPDNYAIKRRNIEDRSPGYQYQQEIQISDGSRDTKPPTDGYQYPSPNGAPRVPLSSTQSSTSIPGSGSQMAPNPTSGPAYDPISSPNAQKSQLSRSSVPITSQAERRGYNLAPPPLQSTSRTSFSAINPNRTSTSPPTNSQTNPLENGTETANSSGDRLEDLINQLIKPKPPKSKRRLTWKCDCSLELSLELDETDASTIESLQDISIICNQTSTAYLKVAKSGKYHVVKCDELADYVFKQSGKVVERH